jgi:molecular chaperone GrpE (heat shock protein)
MPRLLLALLSVCIISTAAAQQQPQKVDPATLEKAATILQLQRNQAWDAAAGCELRVAQANEELAKLKADLAKVQADFDELKKRASDAVPR